MKMKPWLTQGLIRSIQRKNNLFARFHKNRDEQLFKEYKKYRNILNRTIERAKRNYYNERVALNKNDPNQLWKTINDIANIKSRSNITPGNLLNDDGKIASEQSTIAETLNNFFANVGKNMAKKISAVESTNPTPWPTSSINNSLYLSPSTPDEVSSVIDSLNNKKAVRVHDVETKFVKFAKTIISPRISNLFNACITEGIYPTSFKVAEIKPIYKRGDPNKATNYRPISLLSNFDKIFEKLLYNRLISYIEKFELLNERQFGFRKNYDKLVKSIDQNLYSCCVFVDLSKAFDTVDHEILLKKMYHFFGIRGKTQELFRSYLSDRYQYTKVSTSISSNSRISCGVPQGSCLGPILFLMYINDIPNCSKFDISLFADDTYLMLSETNLKELESRVNEELKNLNEWFCRNKLSVNYSKTKFMIINKIPHKSIDEPFKIALNGAVLERTESVKYLGVFIDEKLNWSVHTNHLSLQLAKLTGIFFRLRNYVSKETLYMIYYSLVYSRIQYYCLGMRCKKIFG